MSHGSAPLATGIDAHLARQDRRMLLRLIAYGGGDDGKSNLIGKLLCESKRLFEGQPATVPPDSGEFDAQAKNIEFALGMGGQAGEPAQGFSIDVAYRHFSTERRNFIVADMTGQEPCTRDIAIAASTADAAMLVVDARKGVLAQSRWHSFVATLLGVRQFVVAVNNMDLVDYSEAVFRRIAGEYLALCKDIGIQDPVFIPLSALKGDNIVAPGANMPWHQGPVLIACLETLEINDQRMLRAPVRLPVQWVNRTDAEVRGVAGTIASGSLTTGDRIRVLPSGKESRVARIVTGDTDLTAAVAGQSVTLTLQDDIDISKGDIISSAENPAGVTDQFEARLIWMHEDPMLPGRSYLLKLCGKTVNASITAIKYLIDVNSLAHLAARRLCLNEIGVCNFSLDQPIAFDPYASNRDTGGFILNDRMNNHTVGAGMINFALRRAGNIHMQPVDVDKTARSRIKGQKSCVLWFTGLSGSGKSTIANLVEKRLHALGHHTYLLDGDNVRHGLNRDLGFTDAERVENIRRVAEVAKLMVDAGLIVITAFISPFRADREMARLLFADGEFLEIFIDTPLRIAEQRDPKGLYRKARRGELRNFTGIDSPYEAPSQPELRIDTTVASAEQAADLVVETFSRHAKITGKHAAAQNA